MLESDATDPHSALPSARLACTATRFMATARARTQAGAALWVPADRLASTPTHAAPAPNMPTSATAVKAVDAINKVATTHRRIAALTTVLSETRCSCRGIVKAPAMAPTPKPAERR